MLPIGSETAKAVEAVAHATDNAIDVAKRLGNFFDRILGTSASEAGGILHDKIKAYRARNLLLIQDKWEALIAARQLQGSTKSITPKYAIPILERASLEDNDALQDMWACLLANATDPNKRMDLKRVFADVLASLEPLDVQALCFMSGQGWKMFRTIPGGGITLSMLVRELSSKDEDIQIALQNLHRLGLIIDEFPGRNDAGAFYQPHSGVGTTSFGFRLSKWGTIFRPSPLGFALLNACHP